MRNSKFHKARPVPYALCPKVDTELQSLVVSGILTDVKWSDWTLLIVPLTKKEKAENVCVCANFKVSINPISHCAVPATTYR